MTPNECKKRYLRIANPEAEKKLDSLIEYLDKSECGFYFMSEKIEGENKYVQVIVDIKVSSNKNGRQNVN